MLFFFFAVFAVVFSFPLNDKRRKLQRIYSAVDPSSSNIFKDYIDVKIGAETERNLNRVFVKIDENTKEMLRIFEAMNIKIDNNAKEMNIKIDNNAKGMNNKMDENAKETLRMFEAMNNKMDENAKETLRMFQAMNIKIDNNAKEMNIKINTTTKEISEKIDKSDTKLDSLDKEFRGVKLAASILAAFLGFLVTTNLGTFFKDVVQPFFKM